ncbi:MAG: pyridoxamine 5'-phosphate oxidase family protein [Acidimicrobiales bacterium]
MHLNDGRCRRLLADAEHGVLATRHPERGVDAVPVCFVVDGDAVVVPVDRVKPKVSSDLARVRNLDRDPRCALLCEHWDRSDWSRLWWVRAALTRVGTDVDRRDDFEAALRRKYPQYRGTTFHDVLELRITSISGWAAADGAVR